MRFIRDFLPHLAVSMLLGLIVLIILDEHNPLMNFLTSNVSKVYLLIMCALSLLVIIMYISDRRK